MNPLSSRLSYLCPLAVSMFLKTRPLLTLYFPEWPPAGIIPVPQHYQLVAGYVSIQTTTTQQTNDCGEVVKQVERIERDWVSNAYDIREQNGQVRFITRGAQAALWDSADLQRANGYGSVVYYDLGRIQPFWTQESINAVAQEMTQNGQAPYNYLGGAGAILGLGSGDNCNTFAIALGKRLALPPP